MYIFCPHLPHNLTSLTPPPNNFIYLDVTLTSPLPQLEFIGTHLPILILFIWMFLNPTITIFCLTTPPHNHKFGHPLHYVIISLLISFISLH